VIGFNSMPFLIDFFRVKDLRITLQIKAYNGVADKPPPKIAMT